jgi:hypothetical protein
VKNFTNCIGQRRAIIMESFPQPLPPTGHRSGFPGCFGFLPSADLHEFIRTAPSVLSGVYPSDSTSYPSFSLLISIQIPKGLGFNILSRCIITCQFGTKLLFTIFFYYRYAVQKLTLSQLSHNLPLPLFRFLSSS